MSATDPDSLAALSEWLRAEADKVYPRITKALVWANRLDDALARLDTYRTALAKLAEERIKYLRAAGAAGRYDLADAIDTCLTACGVGSNNND